MKNVLLILMLSFIIACDDKDDKVEEKIDLSGTYLPLAIGNEWQYEVESTTKYYFTLKVTEQIEINNKKYYHLKFIDFKSNYYVEIENMYIRTSDGITYYILIDNEEKIFRVFDFVEINENLYRENQLFAYEVNDERSQIETFLGTKTNYFHTSIMKREVPDYGFYENSLKGIGPVLIFGNAPMINLNYCKIGNNEYGEKVE